VHGAIEDQRVMERLLGEYETKTLFHLAAQSQVGAANRNPVSTYEANIQGTWAVLEAARRSPRIEQIVTASSDKAYGAQPNLPYDEEMPLSAVNPYDVSKACTDLIARSYAATYEMPVAVNGKTQDAVYRAVGRGGVVLISEGPRTRTTRMLEDEKRKIDRVLPNVPVTLLAVGHEEGSVELHRLAATLRKKKRVLTKPEVLAVTNRLNSLQAPLPIPKGIDPMAAANRKGPKPR
jgi:hypothetical protein